MRRRYDLRLLGALLALAVATGCSDEIPTLSEAGELAPGSLPATLQHDVAADELLKSALVLTSATGEDDAPYLLVANEFDGVLNSRVLAQFAAFKDTIQIVENVDSQFTYLDSEVFALVPDSLQASRPLLDFQLWTVTQAWDSTAATWTYADADRGELVAWTSPGGTRGRLIGPARWERAAATDSLVWQVPREIIAQLASGELPGLMVTLQEPGTRAQISNLFIRASIEPSIQRDTVITRVIGPGAQQFIYTPEPLQPSDVLRVGGITSDRTVLLLDLENLLPTCSEPIPAGCPMVEPEDVTLNRVELLLDPVLVGRGFRPIAPLEFVVRRVFEPELGARATLGTVVAVDTVSVEQGAGTGDEPVRALLTGVIETALREGATELGLALLVEPEASVFSYAWFARNPRLRFIYTLPQTPELP